MRKIIRVDGTEVDLWIKRSMPRIKKIIGTKELQGVHLPDGLHIFLWVPDDDVGLAKPVNGKASQVYNLCCKPTEPRLIHGDVVIAPLKDFA